MFCLKLWILFIAVNVLDFGIRCEQSVWIDPSDPHASDLAKSSMESTFDSADDRASWIDPLDHHGYDHLSKTKVHSGKRDASNYNREKAPISCQEKVKDLSHKLSSCQKNSNHQLGDKYLVSLLQRQTAMILDAAGLLSDTSENEEFTFTERYLVVSLSGFELQRLHSFLNNGDLALADLDSIWDSMLVRAENPTVSKWYHISYWKPEISFSLATENLAIYLAVGLVVTIVLMIIMGMPLIRIILLLVFLTFAFSITMTAFKKHQANVERAAHVKNPDLIDKMPSACRPDGWFNRYDKEKCDQYFESYADPMTQLNPFELIFVQLGDTSVIMANAFGKSFSQFVDTSMGDWGMAERLKTFFSSPVKIILLAVMAAVAVFLMIILAPTLFKHCLTAGFHQPRNQNQSESVPQPAPALSPAPVINIILPSTPELESIRRRVSEPTRPQIENTSELEARILKRLQSEPVIVNRAILECPPTPPNEAALNESEEDVVAEPLSPDSGRCTPPLSLNSSTLESETGDHSDSESGTPAGKVKSETQVSSPFIKELEKIADEFSIATGSGEES